MYKFNNQFIISINILLHCINLVI